MKRTAIYFISAVSIVLVSLLLVVKAVQAEKIINITPWLHHTLEQAGENSVESHPALADDSRNYPETKQGGWHRPEARAPMTVSVTILPLVLKNFGTPVIGLPIDEGFESSEVPPAGWEHVQTNPRETWQVLTGTLPPEGAIAATVYPDKQLENQDEVLLSPEFQARRAWLQFYSFGSLYWCRDTSDNCDLNVWLVVDGWGGGDDVLVHTADDDWTNTFEWSFSSVNLTPHLLSGMPVQVGFQYEGAGGAQVGLDAISITSGGALHSGFDPLPNLPAGNRGSRSHTWTAENDD